MGIRVLGTVGDVYKYLPVHGVQLSTGHTDVSHISTNVRNYFSSCLCCISDGIYFTFLVTIQYSANTKICNTHNVSCQLAASEARAVTGSTRKD